MRHVPILMYHEISDEPVAASRLAVAPEAFARQLDYLHDSGRVPVTAGQIASAMSATRRGERGTELPAKPVVLTFDDGFADFHQAALPLLLRHGFTASVFVTTGWIASSPPWPGGPAKMLSWGAIEEIAACGIEIGAHSIRHPELDRLDSGPLHRELAGSKHALEDRLGARVPGMAYPFGYSSRLVRAMAAEVGYEYACTVANRRASGSADPFALPRLTVGRSASMPVFARSVASRRLPVRFAGYRALTAAWAPVRKARAGLNRLVS
ncbi:MAG TPA: polysaccharide deacetylase family protein [Streptosporangiaceae bacterium]|nr:polysaccharide deacetylase family protein [Streptosporangiaceae bacterium]